MSVGSRVDRGGAQRGRNSNAMHINALYIYNRKSLSAMYQHVSKHRNSLFDSQILMFDDTGAA